MKATNLFKAVLLSGAVLLSSCSKDSPTPTPDPIATEYAFSYEGESTVSYGGQTTRLNMASEMMSALASSSTTEAMLNGMFENSGNYFSDNDLNLATSKQIKSKTAVGAENALTSGEQAAVVALFPVWFADYAANVAPIIGDPSIMAAPGVAGWVGNRELNAKGLEYDQIVAKSLIGALCLDQAVNGYLSNTVLDPADNTDRSSGYTTMEHKWDEAYGYVYGKFGPDNSTGDLESDGLLGKYLNKAGFEAEKEAVFNAFIAGRQAIIDQDYAARDIQAAIIKANLSKVVAQKAVDYLTGAANTVANLDADYFHGLSEGYGFILSLQFTNDGNGNAWFTHSEVMAMIATLESGNGLWDRTATELSDMANTIVTVAGL